MGSKPSSPIFVSTSRAHSCFYSEGVMYQVELTARSGSFRLRTASVTTSDRPDEHCGGQTAEYSDTRLKLLTLDFHVSRRPS